MQICLHTEIYPSFIEKAPLKQQNFKIFWQKSVCNFSNPVDLHSKVW